MPNGRNGLVYGGDPDLIHVTDGKRGMAGREMARRLDALMRLNAPDRTQKQSQEQLLCMGCAMIVAFNMLIALADANGQTRTELARTMRNAFDSLLANPDAGMTEEITIILDPC